MLRPNRQRALNYHRKNKFKIIKTAIQIIILVVLAGLLLRAVVDIHSYNEPDKSTWNHRDGFIALSYFGVSRTGTPTLIAKKQLEQHLKVLHEHGYTTISQQDLKDYYNLGKSLPDKALFLTFEDGRNDSSLFAQQLLEKYNFKATILSYANKFESKDSKFLKPEELLNMTKKGYWELGSNGYRLTYINIFDKEGQYVGIKDEVDFKDKQDTEYNHYLMDFIRDENGVPLENRTEMEARITWDYNSMKEIYSRSLGFIPDVYMLMHANSLYNGMNRLVEQINDQHIRALFPIHFNREGNLLNTASDVMHNLTRVQPAAYWQTNHLLMKLQKDTGQAVTFVTGEKSRADHWELLNGAAEFTGNRIALTSPPAGRGLVYLRDSHSYKDINMQLKLSGHESGKQSVYLRFDRQRDTYIKLVFLSDSVQVMQKTEGSTVVQENTYSIAENQLTRQVMAEVRGNSLTLLIDNIPVIEGLELDWSLISGGVALESEYNDELSTNDDIYDGIFDEMVIKSITGANKPSQLLYRNSYSGIEWVVYKMKNTVNQVIDWAIETF